MMDPWPFDQPKNAAVVTVKQIMEGEKPILLATHYSDDEGWAFLTGDTFVMEDALLVALHTLVDLDPTIIKIADLPPGWVAERASVGSQWKRYQNLEED